MIFIGGKATALATSHKLTLTAETGDAASKDDGMWDEGIVTKMSWEASTEALVSADADVESFDTLYDAFIAGEAVDIVSGIPANLTNDGVPSDGWKSPDTKTGQIYYKGKALITSLDRTDAKGSNSSMTVQLKGQGKLEKATGAAS
nr:MAG TPA: tail tube protein [Caudoviricetes sp.]